MKTKLSLVLFLNLTVFLSSAQSTQNWKNWTWIIGEWVGEGSGQPGKGGGQFSFDFELNEKILVRKSHTEFLATTGRPEAVHNDLMIVYPDNSGSPSKAIYFDNEGHVINYAITYAPNSIVFTSEKSANMPVFRLTYSLLENGNVNTKFELSQDGTQFMTYIEGISIKK